MPIGRYEIRNEYALADPELYRSADKDDPEALLEGVAMSALVGVLRQLGDLAEFAAEIFHNLHEEVMAMAARGHGLIGRVQQLESEIPSIERALLSQTDHSSYFKRAGIDWHTNLRVDQNVVTMGDLPRFVRDSYEECRPPPRLFLLDKFDVGGAGACLKRFTDPSFFKVEPSGMTKADVTREKKIRRPKKKGSFLRNGGTPADLSSHTKLHQLFMEERIQTVASNPTRRAKLKRKLNGFPFNKRTETSYMEKLLKYPPLENEVVSKAPLNSSHLTGPAYDHVESGLEVVEVLPVSPDRDTGVRKRSPPSSPDGDEIMLNSSTYKSGEVSIDDTVCEVPDVYFNVATGCHSSPPDREAGEKVIAMDGESSLNGYLSEDIASEVENYVDAPSTVESDAAIDSRLLVEGHQTTSHIENESLISHASSENLQTRSPDSQSTASGEVNISSSLSSDSPSTSYENTRPRRISDEGFLSAIVPEAEAEAEDIPVEQHSETVAEEGMLEGPTTYGKRDSNLDDEENQSNLVMDPPCPPCASESDFQSVDKYRRSSAREHQVDDLDSESTQSKSAVLYAHNHMENSSDIVTSSLPDWDGSEQEGQNLSVKVIPSKIYYSENVISGKSGNARSMNAEDYHLSISFDNQVALENIVFSTKADSSDRLDAVSNAHEGDVIPEEDKTINEPCALETLTYFDVAGPIDTEIRNCIGPDDSEAQGGSFCKPKDFKETAETSEDVEIDIITRCTSFTRHEVTENSDPDDLISLNEGHLVSDEHYYKSSDADMGSSTPALLYDMINSDIPSRVGTDELVEQYIHFLKDSVDEIDHVKNSISRNNDESSLVAELDQAKAALSVSEIISRDNNDNSKGALKSEVSTAILNSHRDWGLELDSSETTHFPTEQSVVNGDHKIFQQSMSDSPCLPSNHKNEEFSLHPVQLNQMSLELPALLPTNNQQMLDHDECTKDQLVSTLPPNNPFLHTNLADLPPLPPLPPVQWRLGKLQPPLSSSGEDSIKNEPLFLLSFSLPIVPTDDATSYDDCPLHEGTGKPMIQIHDESRPEDENVEEYSRVEVKDTQDMVDLSEKSENKQRELLVPTSGGESTSAVEEDGSADMSQVGKLPRSLVEGGSCAEVHTSCETVDLLPMTENKQQELVGLTAPGGESTSAAKEYESENDSRAVRSPWSLIEEGSCAEVNAVGEMVDLSPRSENKQQELIVPISGGESTSAPEEDGNANGSRAGKLPLPRNPIIDELAALDKIKLRKVTEQVRPQIQKVNEKDLFLQQIRTKSFNLRPASTSRPSIRGPSTNLRVAAIVEKANAIRQALADSDEDEDSWSDS